MEHVPTLCAIGTVGIAAAGFALGRQDRTLSPRFASDKKHRPLSSAHASTDFGRGNMSSAHPTQAMPPPVLDETSPAKTTTHQAIRDGPNATETRPHRRETIKGSLRGSMRARLRRQTNGDSSLRNRDGSLSVESSRPSTGQRPSSSWLQRISTISSPRNGSSRSSSCPDSPSMSGSTAQMLPSSVPIGSGVAPNKLVKRSTSQRALSAGNNPTRSLGRSPTTPGLRRPATSHQRASTPSYRDGRRHEFPDAHSYLSNLEPSETTIPSVDDIWHPYFTPTHRTTAHKNHRKRATSANPKGESIRRLAAEPDDLPTLLLATSITPKTQKPISGSENSRVPSNRQTHDPLDHPPPLVSTSRENQNQKFPLSRNRTATSSSTAWNVFGAETPRKPRGLSLSHGRSRNVSHLEEDLETSKTERITPHSSGLRRRRNITDPSVFQRPMTSSQDEFYSAHANSQGKANAPSGLPLPPLPPPFEFDVDILGESARSQPQPTPLPDTRGSFQHQRPPALGSNFSPPVAYPKSKRFSTAASDPASTLIGSDNDTRVFTSGDEDETDFQSDTAYDSFPNRGMRSSDSVSRGPRIDTIFDQPSPQLTKGKLAALEQQAPTKPLTEEAYPSTPIAPGYGNVHDITPSSDFAGKATHTLDYCDIPADGAIHRLPYRAIAREKPQESTVTTGHISEPDHEPDSGKPSDKGSKTCLFDWSEQHKNDRDAEGSAFRPRTVHGKNEANARATRTLTRRGPSVLHLRSQSVPVSRDPNTASEPHYPSTKFGTWGLGNKGVSEDWDGDFEFEESEEPLNASYGGDTKRLTSSCQGMKVPQAIMERQASVHGQFGHVKELTLLVEELRRLRLQAKALGITDGPSIELWKEAEGIINLATVDDDESAFNPPRSPPSPTINIDWCDDESPRSKKGRGSRSHDSDPNRSPLSVRTNYSPSTTPPSRARSASSAKVQSVLDTIYQQRKVPDSVPLEAKTHSQQRLPFDTQSLRDLVVRAGVVTRALKEIVRRAQSVSSEFDNDLVLLDPPFSRIFAQPSSHSSVLQSSNLPNGKGDEGYHGDVSPSVGNENDISGHMKMTTVV